jgi:hypothetical protein
MRIERLQKGNVLALQILSLIGLIRSVDVQVGSLLCHKSYQLFLLKIFRKRIEKFFIKADISEESLREAHHCQNFSLSSWWLLCWRVIFDDRSRHRLYNNSFRWFSNNLIIFHQMRVFFNMYFSLMLQIDYRFDFNLRRHMNQFFFNRVVRNRMVRLLLN